MAPKIFHRHSTTRDWAAGLIFLVFLSACGSDSENATSPSQPQPAPAAATAKIMPLGDSITGSNTGLPSYRFYLWHLLVDRGYRVDFVGSQHGVGNGPPANPDFDMDHEGHAGARADEILAQIHGWATAASPDIVLIHLGTNDLCQGQSVESTVADVGAIIDVLKTVNPKVKILLAQIIPTVFGCQIPTFNAQLPALVAAKNGAQSPVVLVDQYTGFDPTTMTTDGTHPTASGESRMADRWFEKLAPLLDAFGAKS